MEPTVDATAGVQPALNDKCPPTKVNFRFLLISGLKYDLIVDPSDSIEDARKKAFSTWPKGLII